MSIFPTIRKAVAAALVGLGAWVATAPQDGIDTAEWGALASVLIVALTVFVTPNESPGE